MILKRKLVSLKNDQWMKGGKSTFSIKSVANSPSPNAKQMSYSLRANDEQEYQLLISESSKVHKEKTVRLLNQLFDNDITNDKAILLVRNDGDCNMIVRIQGSEQYNLAVPARGENFVTVKKGDYRLSGNMCEARYYSTKSIAQNTKVTLNNTTLTPNRGAHLSKNTIGASN